MKTATTNLGHGKSQYATKNIPGKFIKKLIRAKMPPFGPAWPIPAIANGAYVLSA